MNINFYVNVLIICTIISYIWGCITYNTITTACMTYGKYNNPLFLLFFSLVIIILHHKIYKLHYNTEHHIGNAVLVSLASSILLIIISILSFSFKQKIFKILHYILSVISFSYVLYYFYNYISRSKKFKILSYTIIFTTICMMIFFIFVDNTEYRYIFNIIEMLIIFTMFFIINKFTQNQSLHIHS